MPRTGSSGGGGSVLAGSTIVSGGAVQTVTVSGLAGDSDFLYAVEGRIILEPATRGGTVGLELECNGVTTNMSGRHSDNLTNGIAVTDSELITAGTLSATLDPCTIIVRGLVWAAQSINGASGLSCSFQFISHCDYNNNSGLNHRLDGRWDGAAPLTSLGINAVVSAGDGLEIANGSQLTVWKNKYPSYVA